MWMVRAAQTPSDARDDGEDFSRRDVPQNHLDDAYKLLREARDILIQARDSFENSKAAEDRYLKSEPRKSYSWKEILQIQTKNTQDNGSWSKFRPGDNWRQLAAGDKSGELLFTNEDLMNRPTGCSMVGNLASAKSLRKAIRECFPTIAEEMIERKALNVADINEILIHQLTIHDGVLPRAKEPKIGED